MNAKKRFANASVIWAGAAVAAVIFGFLFGQMSVFQSKTTDYDTQYIIFFYSDPDRDYSDWESQLGSDLISKGSFSDRSETIGIPENLNRPTGFVIFSADSFEDALSIANTHPEKADGIELRAITE